MVRRRNRRNLETIHLLPLGLSREDWRYFSDQLYERAAADRVTLSYLHSSGENETSFVGSSLDLCRFLTNFPNESAQWHLGDHFARPFSSTQAEYWLRPITLYFDCKNQSISSEERKIFDKYGLVCDEEGSILRLTSSLWRCIFLLKDPAFRSEKRFFLDLISLTGPQVMETLKRRHTAPTDEIYRPTYHGDGDGIPTLEELYSRPWEPITCCLGDDASCDFCEEGACL